MREYNNFFSKLANFIVRNSLYLIILVVIFTVFFGIISTQLRVNSDLLEIMPQDSEIVIELQKELLLLEDSDVMVAAFFLNEESDPHQIAKDFSEQMLQESTFSSFIQTDLSFLFSYGIINLSQTDILYEIYENIQSLTNSLTGSFTYDFKIFEQIDTFIDSIYSLEQVLEEGDSSDPVSSYYALSPDKKVMIMGLTFNEPASNLEYVNYIVPRVKSILKNIENNYNIRTGLTNSYIGAYESNKTVMEDFTRTTVLSIILITILFAFAFGNFTLSFIVLIGLLVSTLLTLGFITLTFQELNIVTSFVMAITLGLGIDYGIHIITRFSKQMEEEDFISALTSTYKGVISPIFLGMITTILVFLTLLFMGLPAFNELAIVSSIGLIIFFLVMSFFVPALVYMFKNKIKVGSLTFKINNFFKTLPHKISQHSKIIFIVIAPVVLIFSVIGIFNYINFSYTPPGLISSEAESVKIGEEVLSHFGTASFDTMHYLLRVDEDLEKTKKELMDTGVVKSVSSLPDIIRENIGDFPIIKSQLEGFSQVINNPIIISILNKYNLYSDSLKLIDAAARSSDLYHFTLNTLNILPEDLRNNFLVQKDGYDYLVLEITPKFTLWEDNGIKKFFDALGEEKTERIMGLPKATYKIMEMVRNRFYIPLLLSFVFIWGTTAIVRKNVIQSSEAMLSLILSVLSTFGVSYLIGIRATFVTVLTFPLIFGIGIDGFLHLYHTFSENKMNFWNSLKSITFSLITTTLSFLSFQVSRGDLLKEFSLTMSMSLGFTWLFTTIIFIVNREILRKFWRSKKKTD